MAIFGSEWSNRKELLNVSYAKKRQQMPFDTILKAGLLVKLKLGLSLKRQA